MSVTEWQFMAWHGAVWNLSVPSGEAAFASYTSFCLFINLTLEALILHISMEASMRRQNIFNGSSLGKIYGFSHLSSPSSNKSLCSSRQLSKPGWHKQDPLPRNMAVLLSEARSAWGRTWLQGSWGEKSGTIAQRGFVSLWLWVCTQVLCWVWPEARARGKSP